MSSDAPRLPAAAGKQIPTCWAFFIVLKRKTPRWAIFPLLFFSVLLVRGWCELIVVGIVMNR